MGSINDRLDDLWRNALKSDHTPVEIQRQGMQGMRF